MTQRTKYSIIVAVIVVVVLAAVGAQLNYSRQSVGVTLGGMYAPSSVGLGKMGLSSMGVANSESFSLQRGVSVSDAVAPSAASPDSRLVIKTGSFSLVVANIQDVVTRLAQFVEGKEGFVVSKYISAQDQKPSGSLTVRIPVAQLDALVSEARDASIRVVSEQITGQDVTEEYVDIKAQLVNLVAAEKRFREILTRAQKIEEILNVQREIDRVRSQIDQITARKQYLERSAAMSSVTFYLALDEQELPLVTPGEQWRPKVVYQQAVRGLYSIGRSLGSLVIWFAVLIPVWIVIVAVIVIVRVIIKRRKTKFNKQ